MRWHKSRAGVFCEQRGSHDDLRACHRVPEAVQSGAVQSGALALALLFLLNCGVLVFHESVASSSFPVVRVSGPPPSGNYSKLLTHMFQQVKPTAWDSGVLPVF